MMTITNEDMKQLIRPFALNEHQMREGAGRNKQQWLVYLDKVAVINRLNEVFGGDWGNTMETRQLDNGVVVVDCHITIRGITRGLNGADSQSFNPHDVAKSAGSDAFKRAFTVWGGGLYLYNAPMIYTAGGYKDGKNTDWKKRNAQEKEAWGKFTQWYNQHVTKQGESSDNTTPAPTTKPAQNGVQGESDPPFAQSVEWSKFWMHMKTLGLDNADVHKALGVDSAKDFEGTKSQAMFLLDEYSKNKNKLVKETE